MNIVMASEASVLSLIRSNPIVVFVTSSCNATSCSYCRKAIEELTTKGHDHKVIVATAEEHAVSRLFRKDILKSFKCTWLFLLSNVHDMKQIITRLSGKPSVPNCWVQGKVSVKFRSPNLSRHLISLCNILHCSSLEVAMTDPRVGWVSWKSQAVESSQNCYLNR